MENRDLDLVYGVGTWSKVRRLLDQEAFAAIRRFFFAPFGSYDISYDITYDIL
jgi:hypothetical protein